MKYKAKKESEPNVLSKIAKISEIWYKKDMSSPPFAIEIAKISEIPGWMKAFRSSLI